MLPHPLPSLDAASHDIDDDLDAASHSLNANHSPV
jgi:hypothetical protein